MKEKQHRIDRGGKWKPVFHVSLFIFHFLFLGCLDEIDRHTEGVTGEEEITFSLKVPGGGATRALSEGDENTLSDIFVLVFEPSTEKFLYIASGAIKSGSGTTRSFSVTLRSGTFDLLILANSGKWIAESYPGGIPREEDREEVEKNLLASLTGGGKWKTTSGDFTPLPFHGKLTGAVINSNSDFTSSPLSMTRSVASIDVKVGAGAESDFTLESIYLYNSRSKGRLVPDATLYVQEKATVAGSAVTTPLIYKEGDITIAGRASEGVIYTFEAEEGSTQNFRENTCLVIGGSYKGEGTSYYRVDFRETEADGTLKYLPLLGNHKYKVTINSVAYSGWGSPEEAFNALPISMQAEIVAWEMGYDEDINIGQDMFTLSESRLVFPGLNDGEGTPFTGSIEVKSSKAWTYQISESAVGITENPIDWITHSRRNGTNEDVIDFVIEENLGSKRQAYLHFKTENLTHLATVLQRKQNGPNSYMVQPGGEVEFTIRKVFMVWDDEIMSDQRIPNLTGSITCEVIWEDIENLVTVSLDDPGKREKAKLKVRAINSPGNAVVGIKIDDIIRYSWHIWVTEYDPDTHQNGTTHLYNNGSQDYVFMDRNLGATTATPGAATTSGLLYQWGRKDPFPGADALTGTIKQKTIYGTQIIMAPVPYTSDDKKNNVHHSLISPFCLYYSIGAGDWFTTLSRTTAQNNYLWSDKNGDKELFDPCPDGWRVPPWTCDESTGYPLLSPWEGWTKNNSEWHNNGRTFIDDSFYPGAGYWNGILGLTNVGNYGYYWSATASNTSAASLYFQSSSPSPSSLGARSYGYSVRCVQDN